MVVGFFFIPRGIFRALINSAHDHELSYVELIYMLLRRGLEDYGIWKCDHKEIVWSKKEAKKPHKYCKGCYRHFKEIIKNGKPIDHIPLPEFLDNIEKKAVEEENGLAVWAKSVPMDQESLSKFV